MDPLKSLKVIIQNCGVDLSETASHTRTNVRQDLLLSVGNCLWFAIGGSHLSDGLPHTRASKQRKHVVVLMKADMN